MDGGINLRHVFEIQHHTVVGRISSRLVGLLKEECKIDAKVVGKQDNAEGVKVAIVAEKQVDEAEFNALKDKVDALMTRLKNPSQFNTLLG